MRIRNAGVVVVAALALAIAGGCSNDNATDKDADKKLGGSLVIWADDKRTAALKPFAEQFGKDNGVTVDVKAVSEDLQTNFVSASQAGSGPDIVVGAHDWIGNLVQNSAIDPVQLSAEQKSKFQDIAVKGVTYNGQLYGVPYAVENVALIRNTELAPTAPTSVEDLVTTAKQLRVAGKVSELMCLQVGQTGDAYHIYPLYTSGGGYLFGTKSNGDYDPTDLGVGKAESIAAFDKIRALGEKGEGALKRSIEAGNSISTFTSKKCAYLVSGPWAVTDIKTAGLKYDISAVPGFTGGKAAQPFVGVQAFYVATKGKNKAVAQEFVANYLTRTEVAKALYQAEPRPPALSAALAEVKSSDPDAQKFVDAGKNGVILPAIPEMAAIWDPFGKAEAAVVGGAETNATWHVLPHRAADVRPNTDNVKLKGGAGRVTLRNRTDSGQVGTVDVFVLTGTSPRIAAGQLPGPGDNFATIDLRAVGVRADSSVLQFGVTTFGQRSHPNFPAEFDVFIDTNRDGTDDWRVFNADLAAGSDGRNVVFVQRIGAQTASAFFFTDADLNSANAILTVPLAAVGLAPGSQFDFDLLARDNYFTGGFTDAIENMTVTVGTPRFAASADVVEVPAGGSAGLNITAVPGGAAASPSQTGFLLLNRDAQVGREADEIRVTT